MVYMKELSVQQNDDKVGIIKVFISFLISKVLKVLSLFD